MASGVHNKRLNTYELQAVLFLKAAQTVSRTVYGQLRVWLKALTSLVRGNSLSTSSVFE